MNCFLCPYRRVKCRGRLAELHISKGTKFSGTPTNIICRIFLQGKNLKDGPKNPVKA